MKLKNTICVFKEIHPEFVILVKTGSFYRAYGRDSAIFSFIFGYQINEIQNIKTCGFPKGALNKVINALEEKNINYIILNSSNQYSEEHREDFKSKNNYLYFYEKAKKYMSIKNKIDKINNYMLLNIEQEEIKDKIKKIEEILYGCREI